ncbi:MAG: hypothetical protein Q9227_005983 [Pyrenula ochraceoflavens]
MAIRIAHTDLDKPLLILTHNAEAIESGFKSCFGRDCHETLHEDKDRRKICLWCDRPMSRGRATLERRAAYDQLCLDRALQDRRERTLEDQQQKRRKLWRTFRAARISRQDLRIRQGIPNSDDDDEIGADVPWFLAGLAIVDYEALGVRPPCHESIILASTGFFQYDESFLFQFKDRCKTLNGIKQDELHIQSEGLLSGNTNGQVENLDPTHFAPKTFLPPKYPLHGALDAHSRISPLFAGEQRSVGNNSVGSPSDEADSGGACQNKSATYQTSVSKMPKSESTDDTVQIPESITNDLTPSTSNSEQNGDLMGDVAGAPEESDRNDDQSFEDADFLDDVIAGLAQDDGAANPPSYLSHSSEDMGEDSDFMRDVISNLS